jgi:tRNA wybutosine-synthesizing protein 2
MKAAKNREVEILNKRIIKKYSPGVYHVVVDAFVK